MPTYDYQCQTCGETMEIFQSIKASPLKKARCESCKAERPVRRLIGTGGGVIFKGSGFYQTDYRSETYKSKAKAETDSSTGSSKSESSSDGGKTDAKKSTTASAESKTPAKSTGKDQSKGASKE